MAGQWLSTTCGASLQTTVVSQLYKWTTCELAIVQEKFSHERDTFDSTILPPRTDRIPPLTRHGAQRVSHSCSFVPKLVYLDAESYPALQRV